MRSSLSISSEGTRRRVWHVHAHVGEGTTAILLRTRRQRQGWCRCPAPAAVVSRRRVPSSPDRGGALLLVRARVDPGLPPLGVGHAASCTAAVMRVLLCPRAVVGVGRPVVAAIAPCSSASRQPPPYLRMQLVLHPDPAASCRSMIRVSCGSIRRTMRSPTRPRVHRTAPPRWMRASVALVCSALLDRHCHPITIGTHKS